jgi:hypothetical protein
VAIGALNTVEFFTDDADDRYDNSRIISPEQRQYFAGVTWKRLVGDGLLTTTVGRTFSRFVTVQRDSLNPPQEVFGNRSREGENTLRVDLVLPLSRTVELNVGSVSRFASRLRYDIALDGGFRLDSIGAPQPLAVDTTFTAFRQAAYAEVGVRFGPRVRATLGARADYYGFLEGALSVSPRIGLRAGVGSRTTVTLGAGRYTQAPSYVWLLGDPVNRSRLRPIEADQVVLGLEHQWRPDTRVQLEVYHKWYRRYPARLYRPQAVLAPTGFEDVTSDIPFGLEPLASVATGRAYGVEAFVQKRLSAIPVYGILSLSLSKTTFTSLDGVARPGSFDARLLGNLLLGWRPGPSWELSGKIRVASGLPTTPFVTVGPLAGSPDFTQYNQGARLPLFHALDLRIDKRWSFRRVQLVTYIDVQNVYGRQNVSRYSWDARTGAVETDDSLGVLPSIGVNVEF